MNSSDFLECSSLNDNLAKHVVLYHEIKASGYKLKVKELLQSMRETAEDDLEYSLYFANNKVINSTLQSDKIFNNFKKSADFQLFHFGLF